MAKKKKVRVAFKKNRQKRTRANDMTRGYREADPSAPETASSERVRAKGDLSRHRTVMQEVPEGAEPTATRRLGWRSTSRPASRAGSSGSTA